MKYILAVITFVVFLLAIGMGFTTDIIDGNSDSVTRNNTLE